MTNPSHWNWRGWIFAIGLAVICGFVLWGVHNLALQRGPEFYRNHRTTLLTAANTKAPANIATENISPEFMDVPIDSSADRWQEYRSRPSSTLLTSVEPHSSVRLTAPISTDEGAGLELAIARFQAQSLTNLAKANSSSFQTTSASRLSIQSGSAERTEGLSLSMSKPAIYALAWPQPTRLLSDLKRLQAIRIEQSDLQPNHDKEWAEDVIRHIHSLTQLPSLDNQKAGSLIAILRELAESELSSQTIGRPTLLEQESKRIAYGLLRRTVIWNAIHVATLHVNSNSMDVNSGDSNLHRTIELSEIRANISAVRTDSLATGDGEGWDKYLMLGYLDNVSKRDDSFSEPVAAMVQVILGRMASNQLNEVQQSFVNLPSVHRLAESIQPLAITPVNYVALLTDLETIEEYPEHRCRHNLISAMHSLQYSTEANQVAISEAIETYYRNANLRFAISAALINRLLPSNSVTQRPVRQTVLGADTRGNSQVKTNLKVRLQPDATGWNLNLDLDGRVSSSTSSSRGPAVFYNASQATVHSARGIRITTDRLAVRSVATQVETRDSLKHFDTDYDDLPFVGDVVRYFAQREFREKRGPVKQIMQRIIATQTDTEFDKQLNKQLDQAGTTLDSRLIGPLRSLNLNPMVTDLSTTTDRLIVRYRVAADDALAANTARPQALADSLMSMQMHQSAMNNAFTKLGLSKKNWSLVDLAKTIATQFGQDAELVGTEDVPSDIVIRFADDRPISIEFLDGRMWLTLSVATLAQPGRIELNDFVIRTSYIPSIDKLDAQLVRDGAISVDGNRLSMRERLPLRAIFGKVFAARSTIPLVSTQLLNDPRAEGLAISQIVMEDGWLAISVSDSKSPNVAELRERSLNR